MRKPLRIGLMAALMVLTFALATARALVPTPMAAASPINLETMVILLTIAVAL